MRRERFLINERLYDLQVDPYESTRLPSRGSVYAALRAGLRSFDCGPLCD